MTKNILNQSIRKTVAILDIGSSKILCLIASINDGKVQILGSGCHSANGFKNGNISNSKSAKLSIISAVDQAEKAANLNIDKVVLSLNGNKIKSHYLQPSIILKKNKVNKSDINSLVLYGLKDLEKKGFEVIHYFSLEYIVDNNSGINDPTGLLGNKLSARIHFVAIESSLLENIISTLASCQLNVEDCVFAPYAAGLATLNEVEQEIGSTLIDFGAGITSYAIFAQNNMIHGGSIPVGGSAITNDIAKSFMLDSATAERIKTLHGSANIYTNEHELVNFKTESDADHEDRDILKSELNHVINARLVEILSILKNVLEQQSHLASNAKRNIVITGGGSLLAGITAEATRLFHNKAKLGKPIIYEGLESDLISSSYAAAIGVIKYILDKESTNSIVSLTKTNLFNKAIQWLKENF